MGIEFFHPLSGDIFWSEDENPLHLSLINKPFNDRSCFKRLAKTNLICNQAAVGNRERTKSAANACEGIGEQDQDQGE
jgi:hypothetical protein